MEQSGGRERERERERDRNEKQREQERERTETEKREMGEERERERQLARERERERENGVNSTETSRNGDHTVSDFMRTVLSFPTHRVASWYDSPDVCSSVRS